MFYKTNLNFDENLFFEIDKNTNFEKLGKGRYGTVLIDSIKKIPLIRTTTKYEKSPQLFNNIHLKIIEKINELFSQKFNNCLIEKYNNEYKKMKYHSDQDLDLDEKSLIIVFSCYQYPENKDSYRKLYIKDKISKKTEKIEMSHNSIIVFSYDTNKKFQHKIILENCKTENNWIGMTLRLSKTFITFDNKIPKINNKILFLANEEEEKEFYKLRSQENKELNFVYPKIDYTISKSDLTKYME